MTSSLGVRRAVVGFAATGLLAGAITLGTAGTASAAPTSAPTSAATTTGDHHDHCVWKKGHWTCRP
ncbi:hypothetical protein [Streptomyces coelicoflavus]|uniref:hypothetical protein n=1 Tax=Streptomyces coelicoflavus TaxID=285562 RepID=UPI002E25B593